MTAKLLMVMLLIVSLLYASCASHTAVHPDPVNIQSVIQPGDTIKIVTKDNQETEFVVTEVTDEYIIGENIKVSLKDITEIEEETVSAGKNALRSAGKNALRITILTLLGAAFPEFYTFWSTIPQKQDASKIPTISDGKLVPVEEQKINKTGWRFQYIVIEEGTGKKAVKGKKVKVHYTGKLEDGTEFDSTIKRGEPVEFPL